MQTTTFSFWYTQFWFRDITSPLLWSFRFPTRVKFWNVVRRADLTFFCVLLHWSYQSSCIVSWCGIRNSSTSLLVNAKKSLSLSSLPLLFFLPFISGNLKKYPPLRSLHWQFTLTLRWPVHMNEWSGDIHFLLIYMDQIWIWTELKCCCFFCPCTQF